MTRRARSLEPVVDVVIEGVAWRRALPTAGAVAKRAARAALAAALKTQAPGVEVAIVLTSDSAVRRLNATYRKKDKPTNVLSFPALDKIPAESLTPLILGDVVVAYGTLAREAKAARKSLKSHLSHLVVHGVLHLLGYDHVKVRAAETMEKRETEILAGLGISDPYAEIPPPARPPGRRRRP